MIETKKPGIAVVCIFSLVALLCLLSGAVNPVSVAACVAIGGVGFAIASETPPRLVPRDQAWRLVMIPAALCAGLVFALLRGATMPAQWMLIAGSYITGTRIRALTKLSRI